MTIVMRGLGITPGLGVAPGMYAPVIAAHAMVLEPDIYMAADSEQLPDDEVAVVLAPNPTAGIPEPDLVPEPTVAVDLKPDPYSAGEE